MTAGSNVHFFDSGKFAGLPFSDGVKVGNILFLSGEIASEKQADNSFKVIPGGIKAETKKIFENIQSSLAAKGYEMKDIVKCTVMLADMSEWAEFNEVYKTFFSKPYPARSAFGVNGLALGAKAEVECIAAK
ncbi:endoribonuclease L-PSP [Chania multitudinisentens RB-25]|uniref:Endoribonuclease L-PSP n=1 Tax=Chania multitudinisentens RB-25 TaxID=1441930 RepID=W0LEN8_9GAMM|nr:endoribonuclease L-PSP [Chania multitudinisentens RB-25]